MNKLAYLAIGAVMAVGFASCDEVEGYEPKPQVNPQEELFKIDDLKVDAAVGPFNLEDANNNGQTVQVATAHSSYWPASYYLNLITQISATEDFESFEAVSATQCEVTGDGTWNINIRPDAFNSAYVRGITKDPAQGKCWMRFVPYGSSEDLAANVRLGDADFYYGPYEITVTPITPGQVLYDYYNLLVSPNENLSDAKSYKMLNSGESPYVDPNFEVVVSSEDEADYDGRTLYWGIQDPAGIVYGISDANPEVLVANGKVFEHFSYLSSYKVMANMETLKFRAFTAIESFALCTGPNYLPGRSQRIYTYDYRYYKGFGNLNTGLFFDFDSTVNGNELVYDTNAAQDSKDSGLLVTGHANADNRVPVEYNGLNYVTLDYTTLKYWIAPCKTCGIVGGFAASEWGANPDVEMTPNSNNLIWTSAAFEMKANDEWKFRFNSDWGTNLGGDLDDLAMDGGNFVCEEDGTYIVTLDLSAYPYSAVVEKQ